MLRHIRRLILLAICACLLWGIARKFPVKRENPPSADTSTLPAQTVCASYEAINYSPMQALWISQFDLTPILLQNGVQRAKSDFTERIQTMMQNIGGLGINTVFVQVRPNGDSFYPSRLFPMSAYAVGKIGAASAYDPFAVLLEQAHRFGLSVHAWINPFRLFTEANQNALGEHYLPVQWCRDGSGRAVLVSGVWYLNPADADVRALIVDGVGEILDRYCVDGIHLDDYFYPTTASDFDAESYQAYRRSGGTLSLTEYRQNAVNLLLRSLYRRVHRDEGGRLFGVSPAGNLQRNKTELYADVAAWCSQDGYLDYLCPQVYYGLEHESRPFEAVCREFSDLIQDRPIRLCIGMTAAKACDGADGIPDRYAGSGKNEWIENRDVLARCALLSQTIPHCDGLAWFSYQYFYSPQDGSEVPQSAEEKANLLPLLAPNAVKK